MDRESSGKDLKWQLLKNEKKMECEVAVVMAFCF